MSKLRYFIDVHDRAHGTFPAGLTQVQFEGFFGQYSDACAAEGVVLLAVNVGLPDGRAFCMTMAPDADAVRRAHERVGLPFDSITEVAVAAAHSAFLPQQAA